MLALSQSQCSDTAEILDESLPFRRHVHERLCLHQVNSKFVDHMWRKAPNAKLTRERDGGKVKGRREMNVIVDQR